MSKIEWTDETWNPVTGCTRVSPGCDNCYMFALYPRLRAMGVPGYATAPDDVSLLPDRLQIPLRWKRPRRVFVNSMSDLFHRRVPFAWAALVFEVMVQAGRDRGHIFQVLTKRPGRAVAFWERYKGHSMIGDRWPANVWLGTSVESQKYAPRIDVLARVPAPVRFVSAEPLLGPLDLSFYLYPPAQIDWCIVGGESGPKARPMELDWARQIRDQCVGSGIPFFLKQLGGRRGKRGGEEAVLDGESHVQFPGDWLLGNV